MADSNDVNKEIQIGSINVLLGNPSECCLDLKYASIVDTNGNYPELLHFKYTSNELDSGNIRPLSTATIVPRNSKLNVSFIHYQPALLEEWYEVKVNISNDEHFSIKNMKIEVDLEEDATNAEVSLKPMGPQQKLPVFLEIPTSLDANIQTNTTVFVRAHNVGKYHMQIKITYTLDNEKPVFCIKNDKIVILVVQPFDITVRFLTLMMREVESIYVGEEFGVMIYLKFLSSWPIAIEDTLFEFINPVSSTENSSCNQLEGKIFNNEEVGAELRLAICDKPIEQVSNIGQYTIKWRRKDGHSTTTQITICGLPCLWNPLGLKTISPAHGFVRTPMILYYHLQNRSQQLIQLEVSMEGSEAFMFAGYKQFEVSILPQSTRTLKYNLYPLITGSVALPRLNIKLVESNESLLLQQEQLRLLVERSVPSHLYVMPQVKGNPLYPHAAITTYDITSVN